MFELLNLNDGETQARWVTGALPRPELGPLMRTIDPLNRIYPGLYVLPEFPVPVIAGIISVVNNRQRSGVAQRLLPGDTLRTFRLGLDKIPVELERWGAAGALDMDTDEILTAQGVPLTPGTGNFSAYTAAQAKSVVDLEKEIQRAAIIKAAPSSGVVVGWNPTGTSVDSKGNIEAAIQAIRTAVGFNVPRNLIRVTLIGKAVQAAKTAYDYVSYYKFNVGATRAEQQLADFWDVGEVNFAETPADGLEATWGSEAIVSWKESPEVIGAGYTFRWTKSRGPVTPNVPGVTDVVYGYVEHFQPQLVRAGSIYRLTDPEEDD